MGVEDFLPKISPGQAPPTVIRREKDFALKKLILTAYNGKEYDITDHRLTFMFNEDIFQPFLTGTLSVLDAIDYSQFMPLIGEERLKVVLSRQEETGKGREGDLLPDLELDFRVYKITGRQDQNQKVQTYTMHLISDEFIQNLKKKVYLAWKSVPYSDMVDEVYNDFLSIGAPIEIEPTLYEHDFTTSNFSPMQFINTVACRSISAEGNGEAYVFYQDREGFHYVTLGKLLIGAPIDKYAYGLRQGLVQQSSNFASFDYPIDIDVKNVEHYFWNSQHDVLRNLESGMYAQNLTTVDPVRQKFEFIDFDLTAEFESFKHVDAERFFTDGLDALAAPKAHTKLMHTNKDHDIIGHLVARDPTVRPFKLEEYVQRRTSQLHQINNFRLGLHLTGDPRRKIGQVIEFNLPQVAGDIHNRRPQELDRYFQGKYLIVSIRHTLTQIGYSMELEVIKDTFFKGIEHTDVVDRYKDIV